MSELRALLVIICYCSCSDGTCLAAKSIQGASLPFQGIDYIHSSDSLSLGMFSVGNRITDHVLQENFEDTAGLLVDEPRDPLDTAMSRQAPDGWLGYALNVVTENLAMTLGAAFPKSLATFASSSHGCVSKDTVYCS